jgi:hypothetical protein
MNKLILRLLSYLAILMLISIPLMIKIFENIEYRKGLRAAIINFYTANCNAEIQSIHMTVPLFQVSNFMYIGGREQVWKANINSKDYFEGHYGNQIITLNEPKCVELIRGKDWAYDHEKYAFTNPNDNYFLPVYVNDKKGISEWLLLFYIIFYCLTLVVSFVFTVSALIRRLSRKSKHIS